MSMTDRERAIQAIRRGVPLGKVVTCSCFTDPPTRNGCFGVCEDAVTAIVASYEAIRAESHSQLEQANEELASARAQVTIAKNSNGFTLLAEQEAEKLRSQLVNARSYVTTAIASFKGDRADNQFQRGFLAALEVVRDEAFTYPDDLEKPKGVYGEMCRDPKICAGKGYCPRDPACND